MIDGDAFRRIGLALKILDSTYDCQLKVTAEEIETLKSYLEDDPAELKIEDMAVAVIQQELRRERLSHDGRTGADPIRRSAG